MSAELCPAELPSAHGNAATYVTVETGSGKIRGVKYQGIHRFRGVAYAASTAGKRRFSPPSPFSWSGVRDALDCGSPSPQDPIANDRAHLSWLQDRRPSSEDCLVLNIFTTSLAATAKRPVMVYLHGGAFSSGSGGAEGLDGGNLSRNEVVVVTLNHRLNLFGHLYLGHIDNGRYADSGNAGMLDIVAALEWVRQNIERFGGNPGNVTLFGQSGGGSKVAVLMAMPSARGLFHKACIQSASSMLSMASMEAAERNTHYFLKALELTEKKVDALHELPVQALLYARQAAIKSAGRVDNYRPVVDGTNLPCQPFERDAVRLSSNVPLLIGWCENEQRLTFAKTPEIFHQTASQARTGIANALSAPESAVGKLVDVYAASRPGAPPGDIHAQIVGDHRYRRAITRAAEEQFIHGGAPVHMYLLNWKSPVLDGQLGTPHTLCIAFAFANADIASGITGTGSDRYTLEEEMSRAWVAFAHRGDPNHLGLPSWRPYSPGDRATMVFDRNTALQDDPFKAERLALACFPRYVPAEAEGRMH